jgi:hypothetical protein
VLLAIAIADVDAVNAQKFTNAGEYISFIGTQNREITKDMMSYMSAVAHGKSARKVENRRKELSKTTQEAIKKVKGLQPFEGDKTLRDSTSQYLTKINHVLNDDYGKIVNMEEIAEQSYDKMEAYLTAQDMASDKINEGGKQLGEIEKKFAEKHKVNLVDSKDDLYAKTKIATEVSNYQRVLYLIFFKSYKQEAYMMEALSKKDINGLEQNKAALLKTSEEGIAKLGPIAPYQKDNTLKVACRQSLDFYKAESAKISLLSDFILKEENFQKIKKAFELKPQGDRRKEDVDQYNKATNDFNKAVNEYNNTNNALNAERSKALEGWNKASANFLDKHTPKYR